MTRVYDTAEELIKAVSDETGVGADDVKKVLDASFESTRAYIMRELKQGDVAGQSADIIDIVDVVGTVDS